VTSAVRAPFEAVEDDGGRRALGAIAFIRLGTAATTARYDAIGTTTAGSLSPAAA
jgi:hypothetical protein